MNNSGVLGIGNALTDIMTRLESDAPLTGFNLPKGSMQLVDQATASQIDTITKNFTKTLASGGSAANTIRGLAKLNIKTGFIGKVGNDEFGEFYHQDMKSAGVQPVLLKGKADSGRAVVLVTPDGERTFAVFLGAAIEMTASDLKPEMFDGYSYFHIEGYLVQNHDLILQAAKTAKTKGLKVSIDLASYNVVEENLDFLNMLVSEYADIVFANEEESKAFTGKEPEEALHEIAKNCETAIVKVGKKGSLIKKGNDIFKVGVIDAKPVDTTGAGDLYAAGFFYGLEKNLSLEKCGKIGAVLSGNVIEVVGATMDEQRWERIRKMVKEIV